MKTSRSFVVLGGCGIIGRFVVRDLFESHPDNQVLIADYNEEAAAASARSYHSPRVTAAFADASRPVVLSRLLKKHSAVINCTQHTFNLSVMQAALKARVHYVDLGGLFVWTRKQLRLDRAFRRARLLAVLGGGCAPGVTNVLARHGADQLNRVQAVRIRVGTRDFRARPPGLSFPYSAQTIVEELTLHPWIFSSGSFRRIKPRSRWERVRFPAPVGACWTIATRHSEMATLPLSFQSKGIQYCDFHVGFDKAFVAEVMKRLRAGWTVKKLAALPGPRGRPNDYEIARVVVEGTRGDQRLAITVDAHAKSRADWRASAGDINTGCPPSIIAQMMVSGEITARGVQAPENAVPVQPFFRELAKRNMKVEQRVKRL